MGCHSDARSKLEVEETGNVTGLWRWLILNLMNRVRLIVFVCLLVLLSCEGFVNGLARPYQHRVSSMHHPGRSSLFRLVWERASGSAVAAYETGGPDMVFLVVVPCIRS